MVYRLINKSTLLPFVLMPFLIVLLWGKTLFIGNSPYIVQETPMPFFGFIEPFVMGNKLIPLLSTLFLAFLVMVGINRFNTKFVLMKRQTLVAGFVFLILVSGYPQVQQFHPVWFFLPLFIMAIDRLFSASGNQSDTLELFNAAFLISLGALFYAKALFFIPLVFWIAGLLNLMSFRGFWAILLGFLAPLVITFAIYFVLGREEQIVTAAYENLLHAVAFYDHGWISKGYIGLSLAFILVAMVVVVGKINSMKILTRKLYRVFIAMVVYCLVLAATPFFSLEIIPVIAVGAAYLLAQLFEAFKSTFWQESIFGLLLIATLVMQFTVN